MNDEQTEGMEQGSARIDGRAHALRPSVPLYRHMLYGSGLPQPLDFLVLAHIHYMCEDGKSFCVDDLVEALRNEGVMSANGKGLIGSKAVYQSVARLREVGFLHRSQANGGNFGKVSYTFYEFPSLNPHWTLANIPETATEPVGLTGEAVPTGNHIDAGQTASPDRARADRARADRPRGNQAKRAGQTASPDRLSGHGSPPHPPEEVTTSSPTPHADTDGRSSPPSQTGEGREFSPKEIHAAESFLQRMSKPWNAGRATASKCAPKLLKVMAAQGWPSIFDVDKRVLERDITKNPGGITRHSQVLPGRIADLSLYDVVAPAPAQAPASGTNEPERGPISTESITSLLDSLQGPSL